MKAPTQLAIAAILSSTAGITAQVPIDAWAVAVSKDTFFNTGNGGIYVLSADLSTLTQPSGQTPDTEFANCVSVDPETGVIYYGTSGTSAAPTPNAIFRIDFDPVTGALGNEQLLASNLGGYVSSIEVLRDRIYYIGTGAGGDRAEIGWVPKAGGLATIVDTFPGGTHSGLGNAMCTDGQDVFIGMSFSAQSTDPYNIFAYNVESGVRRDLGSTPIPAYPTQMDIDVEGNLIVAANNGFMYSFDPQATLPPSSPPNALAGGRSPSNAINGFGLLPHQRFGLAVPGLSSSGAPRDILRFDFDIGAGTGAWVPTPVASFVGGLPADIACRSEPPVSWFGEGCPSASGVRARSGVRGTTLLGEVLTFEVYDGGGVTGVFLLFGLSDASFGGLPLPFDLQVIGAPGCFVRHDVLASVSTVTNSSGVASTPLTIPNLPSLSPGRLFCQWGVASPGANNASLIMTQGALVSWR